MIRRLGRDRRGVTVVEFALLAPALLTLVFGILEFGRWLWTMQALQATAAEGARCMAVLDPGCASGGIYSQSNTIRHVQSVAGSWGLSSLSLTIATPNRSASVPLNGGGTLNGLSQISLSYQFTSVVSGFLHGMGDAKNVTAQAYVANWQ